MTNDQITYQHGQIAAGVGEIHRTAAQLESTLADLKSSLQPLVSTWTGAARDEYVAYQQQWDKSAAALREMLARVAAAAGSGNEDMRAADAKASQMWG